MAEVVHQWWVDEAQRDFDSKIFGVTAGIGAGKSHGACQIHHDRCIVNGKGLSCFLTLTYQKIKDSALVAYRQVLTDYGLVEGVDYHVTMSPPVSLYYPALDHTVHFLSGATAEKTMVAVQYTHATVSEAGSQKHDVVERLRERIGRIRGVQAPQLIMEGITQGMNFYADMFDYDPAKGWIEQEEQDYWHAENKMRRFRVTTYDNPFLPDDYVEERVRQYAGNPHFIRAWIYGFFVPLFSGGAYNAYNPEEHDIEDIEPDPYLPIDLTWDFNNNPLAWVAIQQVTFEEPFLRKKRYVAIDEANDDPNHLDEAVLEFGLKFPPRLFADTPIRIYGDMSGHAKSHKAKGSDYDNIKRLLTALGYNSIRIEAARSNPRETDSVEALNHWLRNDEHYICKRCVKYRKSLLATRWKDGARKLDKPSNDTWTHHSDAVKYRAFAAQNNNQDDLRGW